MIFGDGFEAATSVSASDWLAPARTGAFGTVGGLIPAGYPSLARVHAPPPVEHWWPRYRELFERVAEIGARHTSTPDAAWYAIWEGHGWEPGAADAAPVFAAPHRAYHLISGTLANVHSLRYPSDRGWRNPDLWWPDDRRWFVATDVDCWSLYVGGDDAFVDELAQHAGTPVEPVLPSDAIELEN